MAGPFILSENDRKRVAQMVETLRERRKNRPDWNKDKPHEMSPEVYITNGSIGAAFETLLNGLVASHEFLPIYKLGTDDKIVPVLLPSGKQKVLDVHNAREKRVGDGYNTIKRDAYGKWHIEWQCPECASIIPGIVSSSSSSSVGIGSPGSSSSKALSCVSTGGAGFSGVIYADEEDADGNNIFSNIFIWVGNVICLRLDTAVDELNQPGVFRVETRCFEITGVAYTSPFSITVAEFCPWQVRDFATGGGRFNQPPPTSISSSSSSSSSSSV